MVSITMVGPVSNCARGRFESINTAGFREVPFGLRDFLVERMEGDIWQLRCMVIAR